MSRTGPPAARRPSGHAGTKAASGWRRSPRRRRGIVRNRRRGRTPEPWPPPGVSRTAPRPRLAAPERGTRRSSARHGSAPPAPPRSPPVLASPAPGPLSRPDRRPRGSPAAQPAAAAGTPPAPRALPPASPRERFAALPYPKALHEIRHHHPAVAAPVPAPAPALPARPGPNRRDATEEAGAAATRRPSRHGAAASLHTAAPPRRACAWVRRADEASAQVPPGPRPGGGGGRPGRAQNVALDKCCGGSARKE